MSKCRCILCQVMHSLLSDVRVRGPLQDKFRKWYEFRTLPMPLLTISFTNVDHGSSSLSCNKPSMMADSRLSKWEAGMMMMMIINEWMYLHRVDYKHPVLKYGIEWVSRTALICPPTRPILDVWIWVGFVHVWWRLHLKLKLVVIRFGSLDDLTSIGTIHILALESQLHLQSPSQQQGVKIPFPKKTNSKKKPSYIYNR